MATHVYPFHKISDEIIRPWIPVRIINHNDATKSIDVLALLDTGADYCVLPKFVAVELGIDLTTGVREEMQGLGEEKIVVWKHSFKIHLLTPDRKNVFSKSKELIIGVVEHDNIPPILGFCNFMCSFKITFNHKSKKIIIDDHPGV